MVLFRMQIRLNETQDHLRSTNEQVCILHDLTMYMGVHVSPRNGVTHVDRLGDSSRRHSVESLYKDRLNSRMEVPA